MLKIGGLPSNAKPPAGELKNIEQKYSFSYLVQVLDLPSLTRKLSRLAAIGKRWPAGSMLRE